MLDGLIGRYGQAEGYTYLQLQSTGDRRINKEKDRKTGKLVDTRSLPKVSFLHRLVAFLTLYEAHEKYSKAMLKINEMSIFLFLSLIVMAK